MRVFCFAVRRVNYKKNELLFFAVNARNYFLR